MHRKNLRSRLQSGVQSIIQGVVVTIVVVVFIFIIITMAKTIVSYTNSSPQLAIAYGTVVLAIATILLVLITYYIAKKGDERRFIEEQLEDFYDPLLYYFTSKTIFKEDYYQINKILLKKSYLAIEESENKIPFLFALPDEVVMPPNDIDMGGNAKIPLNGWYFNNKQILDRWVSIFNVLKRDAIELAKKYKELNGAEIIENTPKMPSHNFRLNKMQN